MAVVVTLIYVAIQIRQSTAQLRVNSFQTATERYAEFYVDISDDPEKFDMWSRGLESFKLLEPLDQMRFHTHTYRMLWSYRHSIESAEVGVLSDEILLELTMDLASVLKCPGMIEWRQSLQDRAGKTQFDALLDGILATGEATKPINQVLPFLSISKRT